MPLECLQFNGLSGCASYAVSIGLKDFEDYSNHRYDQPEVKDQIFAVIQLLQNVDLPIDHLVINSLYVPSDLTLQNEMEEQLLEKDPNQAFHHETVEIRAIQEIDSVDEIVFEAYKR